MLYTIKRWLYKFYKEVVLCKMGHYELPFQERLASPLSKSPGKCAGG